MTPENHNGPDDSPDDEHDQPAEHRDVYDADPLWLAEASATAAARWYKTTQTRTDLIAKIGNEVGFQHDPDQDRLNKHELAMILVFAKVHNAKL